MWDLSQLVFVQLMTGDLGSEVYESFYREILEGLFLFTFTLPSEYWTTWEFWMTNSILTTVTTQQRSILVDLWGAISFHLPPDVLKSHVLYMLSIVNMLLITMDSQFLIMYFVGEASFYI
jgi:hypothetical protein